MPYLAYRLLLALIAFAIVGGTSLQLAQSAGSIAPVAMAGMPCDSAMPIADAGHGEKMPPCKGMAPDCIKQMCCVASIALPTPLTSIAYAVSFSAVHYWPTASAMSGVDRIPEPLPPRTT